MLNDGLRYIDSRMSEEEEFISSLAPFKIDDRAAVSKGGPILFRKDGLVYSDPSDAHSLIIGDTGSMKTLRFVMPLIYSCAKAGESMVIVDPKGELALKTSTFLRNNGYKLTILNWRTPKYSPDRWNPMGIVQESYNKGKTGLEYANNELNDLMTRIFDQSSVEKDPYWRNSAKQIALGLCKWILKTGKKLSVGSLLDMRHKELDSPSFLSDFQSLPKGSDIYRNLSGYLDLSADTTKSCIRSVFDQILGIFSSSSSLTAMMSESSFKIDKIGQEKTAVFLIVPDEKTTFHFLAALFISQCYEILLSMAGKNGGKLPTRVNFILEEFCNMPRIDDIVPMLTAARSRNIRFHIVIQSYSQMQNKYSDEISKTVIDNCGNLIYLHSREIYFLSYISALAGCNEYNRPLLSVSRLQHLSRDETVLFHDRCYPFVAKDIPLIFEYPLQTQKRGNSSRKIIIKDGV